MNGFAKKAQSLFGVLFVLAGVLCACSQGITGSVQASRTNVYAVRALGTICGMTNAASSNTMV